jgi:hypothetical protein
LWSSYVWFGSADHYKSATQVTNVLDTQHFRAELSCDKVKVECQTMMFEIVFRDKFAARMGSFLGYFSFRPTRTNLAPVHMLFHAIDS